MTTTMDIDFEQVDFFYIFFFLFSLHFPNKRREKKGKKNRNADIDKCRETLTGNHISVERELIRSALHSIFLHYIPEREKTQERKIENR